MALTNSQKADIRLYLGWSARFLQVDSQLEGAIAAVQNDAAHEAQLTALLVEVANIDTKLKAAYPRLQASKVGSIELNSGEIGMLRSEGRRFVGRMASVLGVDVRNDVFSGTHMPASNFVGK